MALVSLDYESDDVEAVTSVLGQMYSNVRLDLLSGSAPFTASIRGDEQLSVARLSMGFQARVSAVPTAMFASVMLLGGGLRTDDGDGRNLGGVVFGQEEITVDCDHCELLVVNLPEAALLRHQTRARGTDAGVIRLSAHRPAVEHAGLWAQAVGHVYRNVVQVDAAFENDLIRTAAFDYLLSMAAQSLPFEVQTPEVGIGAGGATIRRAVAYMDTHLADPITIEDIAAAARVSPRGLQAGFRRQLNITPMTYLRRARLAQAHSELVTDATKTVKDVAAKWGFSNTSRFSRMRRETYGELHP